MDHKLDVEVNHGADASLYLGICSCGWVSGDGRDEEAIREQHRKHLAGEEPAWRMQEGEGSGWDPGQTPGWDR